jgi:hypothetical protein
MAAFGISPLATAMPTRKTSTENVQNVLIAMVPARRIFLEVFVGIPALLSFVQETKI